jgi:HSP20 family protein
MRPRVLAFSLPSEVGDFSDELRQVFNDLGRLFGSESLIAECSPPVDVYESDDALEIAADLPGVEAAAIRVVSKGDSILIAGEKVARRGRGESSFHLVERGYGRFARVVRLPRSCDASKATATFAHGELRVSVPKIGDRRGTAIPITVRTRTGS